MVGGLAMSEGNTMDEKMNALAQGLRGLVPIVGPMMILREGAWAGDKTNL